MNLDPMVMFWFFTAFTVATGICLDRKWYSWAAMAALHAIFAALHTIH